jgi:transcriptional regulator with XRE-family HTH domain
MELGEKIAFSRQKKGMSKEELSKALKVSVDTVKGWESGEVRPEAYMLSLLSSILDEPLEFFLPKETPSENEMAVACHVEEEAKPAASSSAGVPYVLVKVFMIIGMVSTPLSWCLSLFNLFGPSPYVYLALLYYCVSLPLGIVSLLKLKHASNKGETIKYGVLSLIFVSAVAGILMLCMNEGQFPLERKDENK